MLRHFIIVASRLRRRWATVFLNYTASVVQRPHESSFTSSAELSLEKILEKLYNASL